MKRNKNPFDVLPCCARKMLKNNNFFVFIPFPSMSEAKIVFCNILL